MHSKKTFKKEKLLPVEAIARYCSHGNLKSSERYVI
jgi:hypothetical protein